MKKSYLFFIASAILAGNTAFAQFPGFLDPIKEPAWDLTFTSDPLGKIMLKSGILIEEEKVDGLWRNRTKIVGLQDAQGNQLEFSNGEWDTTTGSWSNYSEMKQSFTYDAQNKVTTRRASMVNAGVPFFISNFNYTYDANGKYLPVTSVDSINQGGNWLSFNTQDSIVYNGSGLIGERITSRSVMGFSAPTQKMAFTYNGAGKLTQALLFDYDNDTWMDNERHTYGYDANNNLVAHVTESYNDPSWEINEADSFYYTGANLTTKTSYYNQMGNLEPESSNDYTYTGSEATEVIEKSWNGTQWVNDDKSVITYSGGKIASALIYKWNNNAWEAEHYKRISIMPVGLNNITTETIGLYPNPTSSSITLSGNIALNTVVSIYNLTGKLVNTEVLNNNTINVENLTNGIYFLTFENQGKTVRQKFVKN